ncbi:peptide-methionine (S)-S-oxide reductase MsrA [Candidatus Peregrinibacteria bacterium]|nr:peptide-methionine (S)-S-oxide reductase MsrA [Candidatus Peregrinibacteria bacterium]
MNNIEKATFAAGCFWGVEETYRSLSGVLETRVGYTGGQLENPTYEDVCSGVTGHAEALEITFDNSKIGFTDLLRIFWKSHNPTTKDRQGPDIGHQYRSAIFYHSDQQRQIAEQSKEELDKSGKYKNPVVTEIVPAQKFWSAEEYHQKYLMKRGLDSCHI